jgi:hypothetical protein
LNFYDFQVHDSIGHASAINAVLGEDLALALMRHYFLSLGYEFIALDDACTQGTNRGFRLDKWILLNRGKEKTIFQTEIKNWSAHSYQGKRVPINADEAFMSFFRRKRWERQFNSTDLVPSQKETIKVLTKMLIPQRITGFEQKTLLCFWEPIHSEGLSDSLFEVDVKSEAFKRMTVFSLSNYVMQLLKSTETVEVEMTDADARIAWLEKLYS